MVTITTSSATKSCFQSVQIHQCSCPYAWLSARAGFCRMASLVQPVWLRFETFVVWDFFHRSSFSVKIIDKKWNEDDDRSDDVSKTTDRSKSDSMKWRNDCNCNCDCSSQEPIKFEESVENFRDKKNVAPIFFRRSPDPEKNSPEILEPESLVHFRDGASQLARVRTRLRTTQFRDFRTQNLCAAVLRI